MLRYLFLLLFTYLSYQPIYGNDLNCVCDPTVDRAALLALYNATNGDDWTDSWDTSAATSSWQGVSINTEGCVISIVLRNNNLTGNLPTEIGDLSELITLDLGDNSIGGSIPSTIGNLSKLEVLFLWDNSLIGSIPTTLSDLINLRSLRLYSNQFTGGIPTTIGDLTALTDLQIYNVPTMNGTLPSTLGNLLNLVTLRLFNIGQTGSIPTEIGNLSNLTILQLLGNDLTGNIPTELGNLTQLTRFDLGENMLTGSIPATLGNLTQLEVLDLASNQLDGSIPAALGDLDQLRTLFLSNNDLTGSIPAYLGDLEQLVDLRLQGNDLTGEIPTELTELNNTLTNLNLSNNDLTGCLTADFTVFCNNPNLTVTLVNNPNLGNDDFANFCATGAGGCVINDECGANISNLPMNIDPCGRDSRTVILNGAGVEDSGPFSTCNSSFATNNGADVWFKVTVPTTGNFLIKSDSFSNINLFAEAYSQCPTTADDTIKCQSLSAYPFVMEISGETPGTEVYFRLWDSLNLVSQAGQLAQAEISAHELPTDPADWQLCDFSNDQQNNIGGMGTRKALEFIAEYEDEAAATVARNDLLEAGAKQLKSCDCNGAFLDTWQASSIIELEKLKESSTQNGNVDTTNYNYLIRTIPLVDTLKEKILTQISFGEQTNPAIAMDAMGNYVVVWEGYGRKGDGALESNIFARIFDADGNPTTGELVINNDLTGHDRAPAIAMQANGEFIVVWIGSDNNFSPYEQVLMKRFDIAGNVLTPDKLIASNNGIGSMFSSPQIAVNNNGDYAITWYDENDYSIQILLADENDNIIRTHTALSTTYGYYLPQIALAENGNYAVTAGSFTKPNFPTAGSDEFDIVAQLYKSTGDPIGSSDFSGGNNVNTTVLGAQVEPQIRMNQNGQFVIGWTEETITPSDGGNVMLRRYNATGNALSDEILINNVTVNTQQLTHIGMDGNGDYIVVWNSDLQDGDEFGMYSKYFSSDGTNYGGEFRVNIKPTHNQYDGVVAINDLGNVTYAYTREYLDDDLFERRFFSPASQQALSRYIPIGAQVVNGVKPDYAINNYAPDANTEGNVILAILDSGIQLENSRFDNAKWTFTDDTNCAGNENGQHGYDFNEQDGIPNDTDGHGTAINGLIVNDFPNDLQLELMNIKFHTADTSTLFDGVCGIYYAIENGADIINLSWGFESTEQPAILRHALAAAESAGILVVTSAGNEAKNNDNAQKYPANYSEQLTNLITVTAYDEVADTGERSLAPYANFSDQKVDIAALGTRLTTSLNSDLVCLSGTSLATPAVTRVAAMMKAQYDLPAPQIKQCILDNVTPVAELDGKVKSGGILNEAAAMQCAAANALPIEWLEFTAFAVENTTLLYWQISGIEDFSNFQIEHSIDGFYYKEISVISSEQRNQQQFEFTHLTPVKGENYYRIVQIEKSGARKYSPVRQVFFTGETSLEVSVLPNPARNEIRVLTNLPKVVVANISLTNAVGQVVFNKILSVYNNLNISHLEKGIYFLKVTTEVEEFSTTLMKL